MRALLEWLADQEAVDRVDDATRELALGAWLVSREQTVRALGEDL